MYYTNTCVITLEYYHQMIAEQQRAEELIKLYEVHVAGLKQSIEVRNAHIQLLETQAKHFEQLLEQHKKLDEYEKLLSINEN